jgi:hypothetical protein
MKKILLYISVNICLFANSQLSGTFLPAFQEDIPNAGYSYIARIKHVSYLPYTDMTEFTFHMGMMHWANHYFQENEVLSAMEMAEKNGQLSTKTPNFFPVITRNGRTYAVACWKNGYGWLYLAGEPYELKKGAKVFYK